MAQPRPPESHSPLLIYATLLSPITAAALAVHPRPALATRLAVAIAFVSAVLACVRLHNGGTTMLSYVTGIEMGCACLRAVLLLLVTDPMRECRREAQREDPAQMSYWRRFGWAMSVTHAYRGVGWSIQVAHLPPRPASTRSGFAASRLARLAMHVLLLDTVHSYMSFDPMFTNSRAAADTLRQQRPWLFVLDSGVAIAHLYISANITYDAIALATVAAGCSTPAAWPTLFGRWSDAYTVRRFWGRTWHQLLRRLLGGLGAAFARALGCARDSWVSAHVQLFAAFALSGAAHAVGDCVLRIPGASARFFLAQAVVITLEDAIVAFGNRLGSRRRLR